MPHRLPPLSLAELAQLVVLTRHEAAALARVSVATIDRAISTGALKSHRKGRRRLIDRAALDDWLADDESPPETH